MDKLTRQYALALSSMVDKAVISALIDVLFGAGRLTTSKIHDFYQACIYMVETPGHRRGTEPAKPLLLKSCTNVMHKNPDAFMHFLFSLFRLDEERTTKMQNLIKGSFASELDDSDGNGFSKDTAAFCELVKAITVKIREDLDDEWDE